MTSGEEIGAAWEDLGRQLADLRRSAGLTQRELARRIGFSRSAVAEAETGGGQYSGDFWRRADRELGGGGKLSARRDEVAAVAAAGRAAAARRARQAHAGRPAAAGTGGAAGAEPVVAVRYCPHCHQPLTVVTLLTRARA